MKKTYLNRHPCGFALIEMAICVVIAGAFASIYWNSIQYSNRSDIRSFHETLVLRADQAIVAFAYVYSRLPCPALDANGIESCNGATSGFVPYATLGIPEAREGAVSYQLTQPTNGTGQSFDLTLHNEYFKALQMQGGDSPIAVMASARDATITVPSTAYQFYDFCTVLGVGSGSAIANAYQLAIPDSNGGGSLSGAMANGGPSLMRSSAGIQLVRTVGDLSAKLGCSSVISSGGRAYFNAALAAGVMYRTLQDYVYQLGISLSLSEADLQKQEVSDVTTGLRTAIKGYNEAEAIGKLLSAKDGSALPFATLDFAVLVAYDAINTASMYRYVNNVVNAQNNYDQGNSQIQSLGILQGAILRRAKLSVAGGVHIN